MQIHYHRLYGTINWTSHFSSKNRIKNMNTIFSSTYDIGIMGRVIILILIAKVIVLCSRTNIFVFFFFIHTYIHSYSFHLGVIFLHLHITAKVMHGVLHYKKILQCLLWTSAEFIFLWVKIKTKCQLVQNYFSGL